jgi:putative nucleotidyltransferase with HDIG domain
MKLSDKLKHVLQTVFVVLFALFVIGLVYFGSIPQRYTLEPGDVSDVDITAPRSVQDSYETEKRALESRNAVDPIYIRSEEISQEGTDDISTLFAASKNVRNRFFHADGTMDGTYRTISDTLIQDVADNLGIELTEDESFKLITIDESILTYLQSQSVSIASLILADNVDDAALAESIALHTQEIDNDSGTMYLSNSEFVGSILSKCLKPNSVLDQDATEDAQDTAYSNAMNNPVMIEKGTRIVSYGELVTHDTYQILLDLNLIENKGFDNILLIGISLYMLILFSIIGVYLTRFEAEMVKNLRDILAISLSFFLPILASVYISEFSTLLSPVFFTAVIAATYLGVKSGIVLTILQILVILPIYQFNVEFLFVSIIGTFVCASIAGQKNRKYNFASLILFTSIACFMAALAINLVTKASRTDMLTSSLFSITAGAVSVIASIGFMPIFELLSNTVSPVRLIDLSQPGNPLLKRLFVEAPGTSQHSMMVANLADSAAEAIGADALLARVGSYYHDIGKLDKPLFFTENQQNGNNPHDSLEPEDSAAIITAHPDQGVRLARKYRLPSSIIHIIQEHHGSTVHAFFYHKAKTIAAQKGVSDPSINAFKYRCSIPTSRESAIVMLADTCEAAIRSTGITTLEAAEELFRKLIKQKIDQDQLINSGLSFHDVEMIIRAFLQVYAGSFHERVKYPDDSIIRK